MATRYYMIDTYGTPVESLTARDGKSTALRCGKFNSLPHALRAAGPSARFQIFDRQTNTFVRKEDA